MKVTFLKTVKIGIQKNPDIALARLREKGILVSAESEVHIRSLVFSQDETEVDVYGFKIDRQTTIDEVISLREELCLTNCADETGIELWLQTPDLLQPHEFMHVSTRYQRPCETDLGSLMTLDVHPDGRRVLSLDDAKGRFWASYPPTASFMFYRK